MTKPIQFGEGHYFDSRDVIDRLEQLRAVKDSWGGAMHPAQTKELIALESLEACDLNGWTDGITFVHKNDFAEHAKELFESAGWINFDAMPDVLLNALDIDSMVDAHYDHDEYQEIELDGHTYTYRED